MLDRSFSYLIRPCATCSFHHHADLPSLNFGLLRPPQRLHLWSIYSVSASQSCTGNTLSLSSELYCSNGVPNHLSCSQHALWNSCLRTQSYIDPASDLDLVCSGRHEVWRSHQRRWTCERVGRQWWKEPVGRYGGVQHWRTDPLEHQV